MKFCSIVILIEIADKEKATVTADFNYSPDFPPNGSLSKH